MKDQTLRKMRPKRMEDLEAKERPGGERASSSENREREVNCTGSELSRNPK